MDEHSACAPSATLLRPGDACTDAAATVVTLTSKFMKTDSHIPRCLEKCLMATANKYSNLKRIAQVLT